MAEHPDYLPHGWRSRDDIPPAQQQPSGDSPSRRRLPFCWPSLRFCICMVAFAQSIGSGLGLMKPSWLELSDLQEMMSGDDSAASGSSRSDDSCAAASPRGPLIFVPPIPPDVKIANNLWRNERNRLPARASLKRFKLALMHPADIKDESPQAWTWRTQIGRASRPKHRYHVCPDR